MPTLFATRRGLRMLPAAMMRPPSQRAERRGSSPAWRLVSQAVSVATTLRPASQLWREPRTARVEAVLFVAKTPLSTRKIAELASLADGAEARTLIRRLNQLYTLGGCAFYVEEVAGGYQLLSRRKFAGWLRRLHQSSVETRLSSPAMETLAVVAYRQPVLRATIEAIRGVQCGEMLRQLMERDLVRIVGRADELGRPFLYGTTKKFLQTFGLKNLDELPRAASLRQSATEAQTVESSTGASRSTDSSLITDQTQEPDVTIASLRDIPATTLEDDERLLRNELRASDDDDSFDDEDDDSADDDEEDDLDDDDEEDEDLEDSEWEEVDDDEEEDEEDDLDDEEDDWDDEEEEEDLDAEDDDWDDEDDDEDEDEDDDWEDDE